MSLVVAVYAPNTPSLVGDLGVKHTQTEDALRAIGDEFHDKIDSVVVVSPHFVSVGSLALAIEKKPNQIFDFSGFPPEFYKVKYEPDGDVDLGVSILQALNNEMIPAAKASNWGLDHGAWSPLRLIFPHADKPVLPVSISPSLGADKHFRLGEIIRDSSGSRRIMLLVTGSIVHRLDLWVKGSQRVPDKAVRYLNEVTGYMASGLWDQIWHIPRDLFRAASPEGGEYPLRILAGAVGNHFAGRILANEFEFGSVSLTTVVFTERSH
ncbi:MAG: hypothetical protein QXV22_01960 [Thermoplasmataceae archaeon]